jgi:CNT family concentrative nucleoside transporter
MQSIAALIGIGVFIGLAWALSFKRWLFPWRTVISGLLIQVAIALVILRTDLGRWVFDLAQNAVNRLLAFAGEGARMVFGPLADGALLAEKFGPANAYVFAVSVSATIIVVAALSALLYHWGVLQRVVAAMAWVMQRVMRTSGSESLAAAANIFMGQTEAPLVIRPYLARMTRSELMALMTGGMATIAGGVGAVYVGLGVRVGEPNMAGHLLTASVMSAPAALLIAKVMLPETEVSETAGSAPLKAGRDTSNAVDALCRGAGEGMMLSINVLAMVIAFVAVVALANFIFQSTQSWVGIGTPRTLQELVGWLNAPMAWLMGVPWKDCSVIGGTLGERIVLNEFIGYTSLAAQRTAMEPRSFIIASYALCGFANFGSIAIQIGGIGALAPERRGDFAALGGRAMVGGVLASYITASVAGLVMPA